MKNDNQRKAIIQATVDLLEEASQPERVTSRQIAERAGVNLAMINYYFGSKDKLIAQAVSSILEVTSEFFASPTEPESSPKERLRAILWKICLQVIKYKKYTRVYIPHLLLEEEIFLPQLILPDVRAHFGSSKDETECRIISYEMVSILQLAFYRESAFSLYAGLSLSDEETAARMIDIQIDLLLPDKNKG